MRPDDIVRLRHMSEAAEEICGFVANAKREDLDSNRMLLHSFVRCIEIIGEAATTVSKETHETLPQLPWADMIGMRNRLIHAYFDINKSIVWSTVTQHIPGLLAELRKIPEIQS
jgi:uncharacterized protein with HEPN domain